MSLGKSRQYVSINQIKIEKHKYIRIFPEKNPSSDMKVGIWYLLKDKLYCEQFGPSQTQGFFQMLPKTEGS
jgi:hypothetical protein